MPHLIEPPAEPLSLVELVDELTGAHGAVRGAAQRWARAVPTVDGWGVLAKRTLVPVGGLHPWIGVASQPFAEVVNQLATVERLLDGARWALSVGYVRAVACHPTTSSGGHDLVVQRADGTVGVSEVSDVAGQSGNENRKMLEDLALLVDCHCSHCARGASKYLVTSPSSGAWLARLGRQPARMSTRGLTELVQLATVGADTVITSVR